MTNEDEKCTGSGWTCNFWVAEKARDDNQGFIIDLGCTKHITGIRIRNAQWTDSLNPNHYAGTKEFRLKGAMAPTGPWRLLIQENLPDSKPGLPKPEVLTMGLAQEQVARYIKFETVKRWSKFAALKYLDVIGTL